MATRLMDRIFIATALMLKAMTALCAVENATVEEHQPFNLTCSSSEDNNLALSKQLPNGKYEWLYTLPERTPIKPPDAVVVLNKRSFTYMIYQTSFSNGTKYRCSLLDEKTVFYEVALLVIRKPKIIGSWHANDWFWAKEVANIACNIQYATAEGVDRSINIDIEIPGVNLGQEMFANSWMKTSKVVTPVLLSEDNGKSIFCRVTSPEDSKFSLESRGSLRVISKAAFVVMIVIPTLVGIVCLALLVFVIIRKRKEIRERYQLPQWMKCCFCKNADAPQENMVSSVPHGPPIRDGQPEDPEQSASPSRGQAIGGARSNGVLEKHCGQGSEPPSGTSLDEMFETNLKLFKDKLVIDPDFLIELQSSATVRPNTLEDIRAATSDADKVYILITQLKKSSELEKRLFLRCIIETRQGHIVKEMGLSEAEIRGLKNMGSRASHPDVSYVYKELLIVETRGEDNKRDSTTF